MRSYILRYGLIAGLIISVFMLLSMNYMSHCEGSVDYGVSMLIGYASMLAAFVFVFVGVRKFRNQHNGGFISFGQAFGLGLGIAFIASTMYVVAWQIDFFFFMPDFIDRYVAHSLEELKASGIAQAELDKQTAEMAEFSKSYRNPLFNAAMTYMEILPLGIIVSLVSALVLKKKKA